MSNVIARLSLRLLPKATGKATTFQGKCKANFCPQDPGYAVWINKGDQKIMGRVCC